MLEIEICSTNASLPEHLLGASSELCLKIVPALTGPGLFYGPEGLALESGDGLSSLPNWSQQLRQFSSQGEARLRGALSRSLGLSPGKERCVVDATFGTGKDALHLLSLDIELKAYERHPAIYLLAVDARERSLRDHPELSRLELNFGSVQSSRLKQADAVYYDPMFEGKVEKSALSRKEMQIFQKILGEDRDCEDVFLWAKTVTKRFVVKRADKAVFLFGTPTASYPGKSVRYDLYQF
jgi:16S rRNA (guanine1516-N2)-methyltransferase